MKITESGCLVRIYVGERDKWHGKPLFEALLAKALELDLAGITVFRGLMGFGAKRHMHTAKLLALSEDLPITIEIVDKREKVDTLLPYLDVMVSGGHVVLQPVEVIHYVEERDG